MRLLARAVGALLPFVTLFAACNTAPTQPPIDTSGSVAPNGGGGQPSEDAGDQDGATDSATEPTDAGSDSATSDASSNCLLGTCAGCCTPSGQCVPGTTNAQCGSNGVACVACNPLTQVCTTQICE